MNESSSCRCTRNPQFDAERAYQNLLRKYTLLSDIVAEYIDQAGLDRPTRNRNARRLANLVGRIVGGMPTKAGDFPECCLVGERRTGGTLGWFCTGTLIHPQVVVTAGHCLDFSANFHVALKTINQDQIDESELISARKAIVHPDYRGGNHDIGVLILRRPSGVSPIEIASTEELSAAENTRLVGFGNNDFGSTGGFGIQREVTVPFRALRRSPADDLDDLEDQLRFESDLEFVAGGDGKDSCNGDSGGPAYICVDNVRKLSGVTSRAAGNPTEPCGEGGVYTRVDKHADWIREVIEGAEFGSDSRRSC